MLRIDFKKLNELSYEEYLEERMRQPVTICRLENRICFTLPYDPTANLSLAVAQIPDAHPGPYGAWFMPLAGAKAFLQLLYRRKDFREKYWPVQTTDPELEAMVVEARLKVKRLIHSLRAVKVDGVPDRLRYGKMIPRHYQYQAIRYLMVARRAILAFTCGLGKTITVVSLLKEYRYVRSDDRACMLVACTNSTKFATWAVEIQKFSGFRFQVVDGDAAERAEQWKNLDADIVITSHGITGRDQPSILEAISARKMVGRPFRFFVVDEASALKNITTNQTKACRAIANRIPRFVMLTATPMENNLLELWTLAGLIDRNILGGKNLFMLTYCNIDEGRIRPGVRNGRELRERLAPIMFRRTAKDVGEQLPQAIPHVEMIDVPPLLSKLYQRIRKETLVELQTTGDQQLNITTVLARMTRLKQLCCEPRLIGLPLDEPNPKLERLIELLQNKLVGQKVLIFSQYAEMAQVIYDRLAGEEYNPLLIAGQVKSKDRGRLVESFQTDPRFRVMITTTAGAYGLTLTSASAVIIYDEKWNPQVVNQVIGRTCRIGSENKHVFVIRLLLAGTIEEKIRMLNIRKEGDFNYVVDGQQPDDNHIPGLDEHLDLVDPENLVHELIGERCRQF